MNETQTEKIYRQFFLGLTFIAYTDFSLILVILSLIGLYHVFKYSKDVKHDELAKLALKSIIGVLILHLSLVLTKQIPLLIIPLLIANIFIALLTTKIGDKGLDFIEKESELDSSLLEKSRGNQKYIKISMIAYGLFNLSQVLLAALVPNFYFNSILWTKSKLIVMIVTFGFFLLRSYHLSPFRKLYETNFKIRERYEQKFNEGSPKPK